MTITISASGIALDGPLVAGEKVAVSVSGLALAAEDKPTLALLARFPDALLASVELAESETAGTWTGELDTATKQTALFFATARADERRDAALELVAGRVSLARLTVPMANSALCPKPDGSPFASPVYIPVPGPPGQGGDPYDNPPEMDGEASPGTADEYARGDHRHPTDTTRQAVIADLDAIRSGAAAGATAVQPAALSAYRTATAQDAIDNVQTERIGAVENNAQQALNGVDALDRSKAYGYALAAAYDPNRGSAYAVGDYCTNAGTLFKCTTATANPPGAWDAANWTAVAVTDEMGSGAAYYEIEYLESTGTQYIDTGIVSGLDVRVVADLEWTALSTNATAFGSTWDGGSPNTDRYFVNISSSNAGYLSVGANGSYYNPNTSALAISTGTRHTYDFSVSATATSLLIDGTSALAQSGTFTFSRQYNIFAFARNDRGTAGEKSSIRLYSLKIYSGGVLVRDFVPVRSGFDFGLFDKLSRTFFVNQGTSLFLGGQDVNPPVPTESPAFTGTPTAPTAPAGTNTTQVATTAFVQGEIRYAFASPTPTVSGTSATVACEDRAINDFTVATGITSLTITPPAAVTGRARDFFCRVTLADSSLPTVWLDPGTIDIGQSEVAGMTQGVNLLMFTEIASGHWLASRRSAS